MTEYDQDCWMYGELDVPKLKSKPECMDVANFPAASSCYVHPHAMLVVNAYPKLPKNKTVEEVEKEWAEKCLQESKKWLKRTNDLEGRWFSKNIDNFQDSVTFLQLFLLSWLAVCAGQFG